MKREDRLRSDSSEARARVRVEQALNQRAVPNTLDMEI